MDVDDTFLDKGKLQVLDLAIGRWKLYQVAYQRQVALRWLPWAWICWCASTISQFLQSRWLWSSIHWTPSINNLLPPENLCPASIDVRDAKISKICLEGCTCLDNLFLRGLPNLVELDLLGTRIKILDFTTMVIQVACLKWLFLLGGEHLIAIRWDEKSGHIVHP
jgi:hypothetical protein